MTALFARHALLPDGWRRDVLLQWGGDGRFTAATPDAIAAAGIDTAGIETADYVLPGMINLHSHSFQRALSGLTEIAGNGPDSFWTWRELMYRFALGIAPERLHQVFEPFAHHEPVRDKHVPGVGLGLALSREIAEGLGGRILVSSQVSSGSTFTFVRPRAPVDGAGEGAPSA